MADRDVDLGSLPAGEHSLVLGGYNNQATSKSEKSEIKFGDLSLTLEPGPEEAASESVAFAPDVSAHVYGVDVEAALTDASETLSEIIFEGLPDGVTLNADTSGREGGWTVDVGDLAGLEVTVPEGSAAFEMTVSATLTEENGDTATVAQTLDFSDQMGADSADTMAGEAGDELRFDGVSLADGDSVEITTGGSDPVITIVGKDGAESNKVTLKDSPRRPIVSPVHRPEPIMSATAIRSPNRPTAALPSWLIGSLKP